MIENSIIIPVFGNEKLLLNLLKTLLPSIDEKCEIIIVDDGHAEMKINKSMLPQSVIYISNPKNLGYSGAVNRGIDISKGKYITTINSDLLVDSNWLKETRDTFCKHKETGMLGGKLIYPDYGRVMHAGVYFTPKSQFLAFRMSRSNDILVNEFKVVQAVSDAFATMKKENLIRVGQYDASYFNSIEELDLCFKFKKIGLQNIYNPRIIAYHKTAASGEHRYLKVEHDLKQFFKRWVGEISDDSEDVFKLSKKRFFGSGANMPKSAYIINLNRKNTDSTLNIFESLSGINILSVFDYTKYVSKTPKYMQRSKIDFLECLPFSHLRLKEPIVYICDYFTSVVENKYWAQNRKNQNDIVFDHAFNLYKLNDVIKGEII